MRLKNLMFPIVTVSENVFRSKFVNGVGVTLFRVVILVTLFLVTHGVNASLLTYLYYFGFSFFLYYFFLSAHYEAITEGNILNFSIKVGFLRREFSVQLDEIRSIERSSFTGTFLVMENGDKIKMGSPIEGGIRSFLNDKIGLVEIRYK